MSENREIDATDRRDKTFDKEKLRPHVYSSVAGGMRSTSGDTKAVLLFSLLFALLSYIDAFLYVLGDMVMMNTQMPSSILFIKSVLVLPMTFFFIVIVQKGLRYLSQPRMLEVILIISSVFFLLFGFVIWPYCKRLQPDFFWSRDIFSDGKMKTRHLDFFFPIFLVFSEWASTMLYLVAELWGSLIISFMFFSRAIHQCTEAQVKKFLPTISLISAVVFLSSGLLTKSLNSRRDALPYHEKERLFSQVFIVTSALTVMSAITSFFTDRALAKDDPRHKGKKEHKVRKIGFAGSLKMMQKSRFLRAMTESVVAASVCSNIFEAIYRGGIVLGAVQSSTSKSSYMNRLNAMAQIITSIFLLVMFFKPATHLIERRGWFPVAITAPIVAIITLVLFFPMVFFNNITEGDLIASGEEYVGSFVLENYTGMFLTTIIRISKYCFFDVAKEAASIRVSPVHRHSFRGIHDGLGINIGKTIGSVYCTLVTVVFDVRDVRNVVSVSTVFVGVFCVIWIRSILHINKKYKESIERNDFINVELAEG
ncbi:similarity to ADP/ATP CARRIER PROTEIN [Encephalitozoon cuniculi GB-M1]|uniref:ADP,ATP carrier protein 4 n=2 Tax=Encephalitozoon cuniculi TaxID=6035 RepID=NTT4_ENCCU|nr:ATP/ADP translocase [Encephalitozoon cuniculi GB-M1]Q8SUG7.1 RecName: Full=ADP,ATP carrier protein 4; AltName: Full=ADP/ATP translocase 4; AltName: Full=Nucleotide transporter 4 [Encephalitozoon cuniculi GB-M1]ABW20410.1 NTT4 [Encephalitozoon cuniculi]KMV65193.1 ATP/ADP translocase [Encephalitozoon cuniculi EcunIII-L]AGE96474.1 ADP/ATP carrier protein [Encephalitozoon cuniculi]UYI26500.1 ADP, ATP carrier protein [Encephalitozoon cuniculi]CAD25761.1 similarity to ADP/ATP CARRIER PROTEIN [En